MFIAIHNINGQDYVGYGDDIQEAINSLEKNMDIDGYDGEPPERYTYYDAKEVKVKVGYIIVK